MKTPEQIAKEAMTGESWQAIDPYGVWEEKRGEELRAFIVAAIEADRAERRGRLEDLHAYDYIERDDNGRDDDFDRILIVQIDTPEDIGRVRVYVNDGRIYDEDPETGQEWSLT